MWKGVGKELTCGWIDETSQMAPQFSHYSSRIRHDYRDTVNLRVLPTRQNLAPYQHRHEGWVRGHVILALRVNGGARFAAASFAIMNNTEKKIFVLIAVQIILHLLTFLGIIIVLSLLGVGGSTSCSESSNTVTGQGNCSCLLSDQLNQIVPTLSNIKQTGISTAGVSDDILGIVEELLQLQNASSIFNSITPVSCLDIKAALPNSPSGYYHVNSRNIYCNMGELCGSGGGWTRLAYLDMTDSTENCPSGFKLYQSGGVRACGRATSSVGSCVSVQFPSNGIGYSQVCGRVVGYQYTSTDAVDTILGGTSSHNDINSYYVDGVSITRGSPRQHVWTLMAGLHEASFYNAVNDGRFNCPCSAGSTQNSTLQSFIGNDYYCESGNPATDGSIQHILYTSDPLWDGKGCGSLEENCCTAPGLPWFHKVLNTTTTDYLELRVCADESTVYDDAPVSFYEIYVK